MARKEKVSWLTLVPEQKGTMGVLKRERKKDSEPSLTSFRTTLRDVIPRHASAEGPLGLRLRVTAEGLAQKTFLYFYQPLSLVRLFKKAPYSVVPSVSEASLTSFGTVFPWRPIGLRLGVTKK